MWHYVAQARGCERSRIEQARARLREAREHGTKLRRAQHDELDQRTRLHRRVARLVAEERALAEEVASLELCVTRVGRSAR